MQKKKRKATKDTLEIYDAVPHADVCKYYVYHCGAPSCNFYAADNIGVRNTVLVLGEGAGSEYDAVYFTCQEGHRNRLRI